MNGLLHWISRWFTTVRRDVDKFLREVATPSVQIANLVKQFVDNPALDLVVLVTETKIDNAILVAFRKAIDSIASKLSLISTVEGCTKLEDPVEMIKCLSGIVEGIKPEWRGEAYKVIATGIAKYREEHPIKDNEVNTLIEIALQKLISDKQ